MAQRQLIEVAKKNSVNIICVVIALLAMTAWLWPISGMYDDFINKKLKVSTGSDVALRSLATQPRFVPSITDDAQPVKLARFPNKATIEEALKATTGLKQQSDETLAFAVLTNHEGHELLERGSLPQPLENAGFRFRTRYNDVMDPGKIPEKWDPRKPDEGPWNLPDEILNSTHLATDEDIKAALDKKWDEEFKQRIITVNGVEVNRQALEAEFQAQTVTFARDIHRSRATGFKLYLEPGALRRAPHVGPSDTPSATEIWFAQMVLWIEQDVCKSIRDVNRDANGGIAQSPVKDLVEVSLPTDATMYVMDHQVAASPGAAPAPETDPLTRVYARSPTGRVCNTLYDVVQFRVVVIVEAAQVQRLLESLRNQRFMTVIQLSAQNEDTRAAESQGYEFGSKPCINLTLDCETLYMRDWTVRTLPTPPDTTPGVGPMPLEVQQKVLGIPPPAAAPATPAPPAVRASLQ